MAYIAKATCDRDTDIAIVINALHQLWIEYPTLTFSQLLSKLFISPSMLHGLDDDSIIHIMYEELNRPGKYDKYI